MHDDPILTLKRQLADAIVALAARKPVTVAARRLGIDAARMCDLRHVHPLGPNAAPPETRLASGP